MNELDNITSTGADADPSSAPDTDLNTGTATPTPSTSPQDPQTGHPVDLDSLDRYRYEGRPLKAGYMRQQDYTQKTTELAQERKYYDNLAVDLDRVKSNPHLAEQFRSIYPEKFHAYLRYVTENSGQSQRPPSGPAPQGTESPQQPQYARLDPATEQRLHQLEKGIREKEVATISAELDHKFKGLSEKYPFADEEAVVARAQALLAKLKEQDPLNRDLKISDKQWDLLWKSQHERSYGLSDAQYKKQVQSQLNANRKGSETGRGGGIPGQAPRQARTIKEATSFALADIESGTF